MGFLTAAAPTADRAGQATGAAAGAATGLARPSGFGPLLRGAASSGLQSGVQGFIQGPPAPELAQAPTLAQFQQQPVNLLQLLSQLSALQAPQGQAPTLQVPPLASGRF